MLRRNVFQFAACAAMTLSFLGLSAPAQAVELDSLNGRQKPVKVEVPANPQRIAVLDMAVLDMLQNWNLLDRVGRCRRRRPFRF